jgi:tetratricopeptide (TPR) repeat protein
MAQLWQKIKVGLMMAVVVIPNQLLVSHKLLAQPSDRYSSQRQCKAPMSSERPILEDQGVAQEALLACDRALANTPQNSSILIILQNKALALQTLGRYEEAIAIWDQTISIDPRFGSNRANAVRELERRLLWYSNRPIQIPDTWVKALTEALRLSIMNMKQPNYPVYSDWKLSPREIADVSRRCTKKVVLPEQFANNPALARSITECRVRVILNEEYYQSKNNELEAVRRAAAMYWFATTDPRSINSPEKAPFLQEVVNNYRRLRSASKG